MRVISTNDGNALPHAVVLGVIELPSLSDGAHTVTVYGEFDFSDEAMKNSYNITFFIDATSKPTPSLTATPTGNPTDTPNSNNTVGYQNLVLLAVIMAIMVVALATLVVLYRREK